MKTWSRERPSAEQSKRIEQMVDHVAPERKKERLRKFHSGKKKPGKWKKEEKDKNYLDYYKLKGRLTIL